MSEAGTYTALMKLWRSIPAVVVAASCVIGRPDALSAQDSVQRTAYVSVLDADGAPVSGLGPSDFIIREDGVSREVLRVAPATDPMQIAILVDNSTASQSLLTPLREGVTALAKALSEPMDGGSHNEVALITFGERPTVLTDYTMNVNQLLQGVGRLFPRTDSAAYLLDALYETSMGFIRAEAPRPVIIVITTEGVDYSTRRREAVLGALDRVDGLFHAIIIGRMAVDLSDQGQDREVVLSQGTEKHGGRQKVLLSAMSLPATLTALAAELRAQYRVTYSRPDMLIPPETMTVEARRAGLNAYGIAAKEPFGRGPR
jgi:VWFA-related protein